MAVSARAAARAELRLISKPLLKAQAEDVVAAFRHAPAAPCRAATGRRGGFSFMIECISAG